MLPVVTHQSKKKQRLSLFKVTREKAIDEHWPQHSCCVCPLFCSTVLKPIISDRPYWRRHWRSRTQHSSHHSYFPRSCALCTMTSGRNVRETVVALRSVSKTSTLYYTATPRTGARRMTSEDTHCPVWKPTSSVTVNYPVVSLNKIRRQQNINQKQRLQRV